MKTAYELPLLKTLKRFPISPRVEILIFTVTYKADGIWPLINSLNSFFYLCVVRVTASLSLSLQPAWYLGLTCHLPRYLGWLMFSPFHKFSMKPWVRKIPWRRKWQPTPVILWGEFYEQGSLACCGPAGSKEQDTTEQLNNNKNNRVEQYYVFPYLEPRA